MTARDRARLVAEIEALGTAALPCIRLPQELTARSRGSVPVRSARWHGLYPELGEVAGAAG